MNNFIIRDFKTKDIDRSGYFENINIGFKSTIIDIPMFLFDAEGETTAINSFLSHKIDPITHEICETITLDSSLIKLHANGYFYLDKTNLSVLFDVDDYYYLEISNGNKTWNSQIFKTITIPIATLAINSFVANDYIQGIDTSLSATFNATATGKGLATFNFTWDFGTQQVTTTIQQSVSVGDTVILNPTALAPSGVFSGTYTLTVSGSVSVSDDFNYYIPIILETSITDYTTQTSGITLNFTGNVIGKWIDEPSEFNFAQGVENIRNYTANGTYNLLIYGDLSNITNVDFTNANIVNTVDLTLTGLTGKEFGLSQNKITELNIENLNVTQINQDYPTGYGLSSDIQKIYAKNTKLTQLWNDNDTWSNLDYLDLSNVTTLIKLYLSSTKLSEVVGFNTLVNLELLKIENLTTWTSKTLDISNFINLKQLYTTNTDFSNGIIGLNQTTNLQYVNLINNNLNGVLDLSLNSNLFNGGLTASGQFLNGNDFTEIKLNNSKFSFLNGVYDTLQGSNNLTKLHIQNNVNLDRVSAQNKTLLTDVNLTGSRLFRAYFDGCALTQLSVDNVIQTAVTGGVLNGFIKLELGTNAAPSAAGLANISILVSRGWTVNHN